MATSTQTINDTLGDDTRFREFVADFITAMTACGMIRTADTGQVDELTTTRPVAVIGSDATRYAIFRFNDDIQSAHPTYLKVAFGLGNTTSSTPALQLSIGTGTDGAGTLTGKSSPTQNFSASASTGGAGTVRNWHFSGNSGRICMFGNINAAATTYCIWLAIERTKDDNGIRNSDGYAIAAAAAGGAASGFHIRRDSEYQGAPASWSSSSHAVGVAPTASTSAGGNVAAFPVFMYLDRMYPPWEGLVSYVKADFTELVDVTIPVRGVNRTFKPIGATLSALQVERDTNAVGRANASMMMLFE